MKRETMVLYGGSFDPVHRGHLAIARAAQDHLEADIIRFLPCRVSPHKVDGAGPACGSDRREMLRLATRGWRGAVVDGRELEREGVSYSWETAAEIGAEFPGIRLVWLMGGDQWQALPTWRHPERLAGMVEFLVVARAGSPVLARDGYRVEFLEADFPESSSAIRRMLAAGEEVPPGWLLPEVDGYIRSRGLYRSGGETPSRLRV